MKRNKKILLVVCLCFIVILLPFAIALSNIEFDFGNGKEEPTTGIVVPPDELPEFSISDTYKFHIAPELEGVELHQEVSFESNGAEFDSITVSEGVIKYNDVIVYSDGEWVSESYWYLRFGEESQAVYEDFNTWFSANADVHTGIVVIDVAPGTDYGDIILPIN